MPTQSTKPQQLIFGYITYTHLMSQLVECNNYAESPAACKSVSFTTSFLFQQNLAEQMKNGKTLLDKIKRLKLIFLLLTLVDLTAIIYITAYTLCHTLQDEMQAILTYVLPKQTILPGLLIVYGIYTVSSVYKTSIQIFCLLQKTYSSIALALFYGLSEGLADIHFVLTRDIDTYSIGLKMIKLVHATLLGTLAYIAFHIRQKCIMVTSGHFKRMEGTRNTNPNQELMYFEGISWKCINCGKMLTESCVVKMETLCKKCGGQVNFSYEIQDEWFEDSIVCT